MLFYSLLMCSHLLYVALVVLYVFSVYVCLVLFVVTYFVCVYGFHVLPLIVLCALTFVELIVLFVRMWFHLVLFVLCLVYVVMCLFIWFCLCLLIVVFVCVYVLCVSFHVVVVGLNVLNLLVYVGWFYYSKASASKESLLKKGNKIELFVPIPISELLKSRLSDYIFRFLSWVYGNLKKFFIFFKKGTLDLWCLDHFWREKLYFVILDADFEKHIFRAFGYSIRVSF